MKYTLQLNTGSFSRSVFDKDIVLSKLDKCLSSLNVSRVIFGWSPDRAINELIVDYLTAQNIEKYFWLPIFGEIHSGTDSDRFCAIDGAGNASIDNLCEGENFDFVCQSSKRNLEHAISVFETLMKDLPVNGVFIDRIRYSSPANSRNALFGCFCPRCISEYEKAGIDVDRLRAISRTDEDLFVPDNISDLKYHFKDSDINSLMNVKRKIINNAVSVLSEYFHSHGKKVGIDTFAPCVSDFVGQDNSSLGNMVDFIKPMFYLRTDAPAGVPFELNALGDKIHGKINELWGGDCMSTAATDMQLRALLAKGLQVSPGIDSNRIDGICRADDDYVLNAVSECESCGCEEVVLSWDILRISDSTIQKAGKL